MPTRRDPMTKKETLASVKRKARMQEWRQREHDLAVRGGGISAEDYRMQVNHFIAAIGEEDRIGGLTLGQTRLVKAFFANEGDEARAVRACGLDPRHADMLFDDPVVQREIAVQREALENATTLSEEWIVKRLMRYADAPRLLARFKKIASDGTLYWDFRGAGYEELALITELSSTVSADPKDKGKIVKSFKIKMADPKAALDSLARIQGAFKDTKAVDKIGDAFVELLNQGRERVRGGVEPSVGLLETEPL